MWGCCRSEGQRDHSQAMCKRQGMVQGEGSEQSTGSVYHPATTYEKRRLQQSWGGGGREFPGTSSHLRAAAELGR